MERMDDVVRSRRGWPSLIDGPYVVECAWSLTSGERPRVVCIGVQLRTYAEANEPQLADYAGPRIPGSEPRPLTVDAWRAVPLATIVNQERRAIASGMAETWPQLANAWRRPTPRSEDRKRGDHEATAAVYNSAAENPTKAVQEAFGLSYGAAAMRVRRARAAGFLAKTTRGRVAQGATDEGQR